MNNKIRVLACGWYGAGNMGDEFLLEMLRRWSNEMGATLSVLSINPAHTQTMHQVEAIDAYDLPTVAHAMQRSNLLILGGGGLFQTHHKFTIPALYSYRQADISAYARPLLMARQLGVPTLLWAQGVGPLEGDEPRQIVRDIFSEATYASVRDQDSLSLLTEIGVSRSITMAPDPVWAYSPPKGSHHNAGSRKRVALVLRPWPVVQGWEDHFIEALKNAVSVQSYTLVWIPFQALDVPGRSESDAPHVRRLMQRVGSAYIHEWLECTTISEIAQALDECDSVVCMRLHAQILALRMGKPTLCIEYDPKMTAVSLQAKVPERVRLEPDANLNTWRDTFVAWSNEGQPARATTDRASQLAEQAMAHRQVLWDAIKAANTREGESRWQAGNFDWLSAWLEEWSHQILVERDKQIATLNHSVTQRDDRITERDEQIISLNQTVAEHKGQTSTANQALAVCNRQIAGLNMALQAEKAEIQKLKSSTSWRLTRPLRFTKLFGQNPKRAAYNFAEFVYWRLPPATRQATRRLNHKFGGRVKWLLSPLSTNNEQTNRSTQDLSWEDFNTQVLSRRGEYKGVFVQEIIIDWNVPLYQRPQHIATALGGLGYLVIYKSNNWTADDVDGFKEVSKNVWLTNRHEVEQIEGVVRSFYSTAYANTPELLLENGKRGLLVYEYIDHIDAQISGDAENIRRLLAQKNFAFSGGADYIVVSARKLEAEAIEAVGRDKVILIQNGVDTQHYRNPVHQSTPLPDNLVSFTNKYSNIVGYFGALAPWLWYSTISELVETRQDLGFVFIGPDYYGGAEKLPRPDNVLYLGTVDYAILPAYATQFDVCFIPFAPGEIARTTSPLKLFEYFALEKPVVVTSEMRECVAFKEVFSGDSAKTLGQAINDAIKVKSDPPFKARLAQLADENSWGERALAMEIVFEKFRSQSNQNCGKNN